MHRELQALIKELLCSPPRFLHGVHQESKSFPQLAAAVQQWSSCLSRDLSEVLRTFEPALRQSVLMTLLPARALDPNYAGSYDAAIVEHLSALGIALEEPEIAAIRNVIINVRKLQGLNARQARAKTESLATVKATPHYGRMRAQQGNRCHWCGVSLDDPNVIETLEHVVPKHLGDDPPDGSNWALACLSCNVGKADLLAWSASQWAYDYFDRNHSLTPNSLELTHRWIVLRRTPECSQCGLDSRHTELWIYRRVRTGIPIPSNCSVACETCARARRSDLDLLTVKWHDSERGRGLI